MLRHYLSCLSIILFSLSQSQAQQLKARPKATPQMLLQGIWAADKDENALFWVDGSRLTYVEFLEQHLRYTITRLTIFQVDGSYSYPIKKLTRDSLVYVMPSSGYVVRLYKRKI